MVVHLIGNKIIVCYVIFTSKYEEEKNHVTIKSSLVNLRFMYEDNDVVKWAFHV